MSKFDAGTFISSTPLSGSATTSAYDDGTAVEAHAPNKKSVFDLVIEAVKVVGVKRKGASYQAIKNYVQDAYNLDEDKEKKLPLIYIRKAIMKAIDTGRLEKSQSSKNTTGILGYYVLNKKGNNSKPQAATEEKKSKNTKMAKAELSDSETIPKKLGRPKKLNLSDSVIHEIDKTKIRMDTFALLEKKNKPKPKNATKSKVNELRKDKNEAPVKAKVKHDEKKSKTIRQKAEVDRKDVSDSEIVVKKPNRRSLKINLSDTEISPIKEKSKPKNKITQKATKTKNSKKVQDEKPSALVPAKGKKLFKPEEIPTERKKRKG